MKGSGAAGGGMTVSLMPPPESGAPAVVSVPPPGSGVGGGASGVAAAAAAAGFGFGSAGSGAPGSVSITTAASDLLRPRTAARRTRRQSELSAPLMIDARIDVDDSVRRAFPPRPAALASKTIFRSVRMPPAASVSWPSTGRPIVSQRTATRTSATASGTARDLPPRTALEAGRRWGRLT
jgi:hypothetical protein